MMDHITIPLAASLLILDCAFIVRGFVPEPTATELGVRIVEETFDSWSVMRTFVRNGPPRVDMGRRMARFGDPGVLYTYKDKPRPMRPFTPALDQARRLVSAALGWTPNCVVINAYAPSTGLYPHRDGRYNPELGDVPAIASLSFGATRTFTLFPTDPATNKRLKGAEPINVQLGSVDLFVMHGECDRLFQHGLPEEPDSWHSSVPHVQAAPQCRRKVVRCEACITELEA